MSQAWPERLPAAVAALALATACVVGAYAHVIQQSGKTTTLDFTDQDGKKLVAKLPAPLGKSCRARTTTATGSTPAT